MLPSLHTDQSSGTVGNKSSGVTRNVADRRNPIGWKIPLFSFPVSEVQVGDLELAFSQCGERG